MSWGQFFQAFQGRGIHGIVSRHRCWLSRFSLLCAVVNIGSCGGAGGEGSVAASSDAGTWPNDTVPVTTGTSKPTIRFDEPATDFVIDEGQELVIQLSIGDGVDSLADLTVVLADSVLGVLSKPKVTDAVARASTAMLPVGPHVLTATATDRDGNTAQDSVSIRVNGPPAACTVVLTPENPRTSDVIIAVGSASDPNDDPLSYHFSWTRNGVAVDALTGNTVPNNLTAKGDTWRVAATADDSRLFSPECQASVVIQNSAPAYAAAVILPSNAFLTSHLTCTGLQWTDADGDAEGAVVEWRHGTTVAGNQPSIDVPSTLQVGDTLTCSVTPTDGQSFGTAAVTSVVIWNEAPNVVSLSLGPPLLTETFTPTCLATAADPEGKPTTIAYSWRVNGIADPASVGPTLSASAYSKGDEIQCCAVPSDGESDGASLCSDIITAANAAPGVGPALVQPAEATAASTLKCFAPPPSDPDGDTSATSCVFYVQGTDVPLNESGECLLSNEPGATPVFAKGQVVCC